MSYYFVSADALRGFFLIFRLIFFSRMRPLIHVLVDALKQLRCELFASPMHIRPDTWLCFYSTLF